MAKELKTEVIINASPSTIWNILIEFDLYPEWNPFIKSIKGLPIEGSRVSARLEPPDYRGMTISPTILEVTDEKALRWLGHLFFPGLFDGEHIFELIDNNNGTTTFIQREKFRGILVSLFNKMLDNNTYRGFVLMNQQLKTKAEQQ